MSERIRVSESVLSTLSNGRMIFGLKSLNAFLELLSPSIEKLCLEHIIELNESLEGVINE